MNRRDQRLIFFDLDGCLVNSTEPIQESLNQAFAENGLPLIPEGGLSRFIGPPLRVSLSGVVAENQRDPALVDVLLDRYREIYIPMSVKQPEAYPGVPQLVARLAQGERVGVVTSKPQHYAVPIIEALGLDVHFEVMVGPDLNEAEPKTETLARALKLVAPCNVLNSVMIGDRMFDIEAARAHGLYGIGVTWGFGSRDEFAAAGAHSVVDSADELATVLAELPGAP